MVGPGPGIGTRRGGRVLAPETALCAPDHDSTMQATVLQLSSLLEDPIFLALVALMLLLVFFGYLLVRRTLLSLREGYDEGYR